MNGYKNPTQNAARVGSTKIGQYFLIAFSIVIPFQKKEGAS